jgi:hypothetical protein
MSEPGAEAPPERRDLLQQKLHDFLSANSLTVDQIQAAVLLHNPPLFLAFIGLFLSFTLISITITTDFISPIAYVLVLWPAYSLAKEFALRQIKTFIVRLYIQIPQLGEDVAYRLRSPDELTDLVLPAVVWRDSVGAWHHRTLAHPGAVDTTVLILGTLLVGFVCRAVNPFGLIAVSGCAVLGLPALLTRSNFLEYWRSMLKGLAAKPPENDPISREGI